MNGKSTALVAILTIFGVAIGSVLGYLAPSFMLATSFLGSIYLSVLVLIALPLIISSVGSGIAALGSRQKVYRTFGKTSAYYGLTGLLAVVLGATVVHLVGPGKTAGLTGGSTEILGNYSQTLAEFFGAFFSVSPLTAIGIGQYLPLVVLALLFGTATASVIGRSRTLITLIREANNVFSRLIRSWSMFAPIGLASLVGAQVARYSGQMDNIRGYLGSYFLTTAIAIIAFGVIALPLILKFMGRVNGFSFLSNSFQSLVTAFGTGSSAYTFPVTHNAVTKDNEIDERSSSLVLPLGLVMNFGATAMFTIIATVFLVQASGIELGYGQMMIVSFSAILLSLGTSGLPGVTGSILMVTLTSIGLGAATDPRFAPALIAVLVLDLLLFDRIRAALNVWSDSIGAAVIAQTFEMKTARSTGSDSDRTRRPYTRDRDQSGRSGPGRGGRPGDRYDRGSRRPDSRSGRRGSSSDSGRSHTRDYQNRPRPTPTPTDDRPDRREKQAAPSPFEMSATSNVIEQLESGTPAKTEPAVKKTSADSPGRAPVTRRSTARSRENTQSARAPRARRTVSDAPPRVRRSATAQPKSQPSPVAAEESKSSAMNTTSEAISIKKDRVVTQVTETPQPDIFKRAEPEKKQEPIVESPKPVQAVKARETAPEVTPPKVDVVVKERPSPVSEVSVQTTKSPETEKIAIPAMDVKPKQEIEKPEPVRISRTSPGKSAVDSNDKQAEVKAQEVTAAADSSPSSESMSFGRARKKRIR